jgi:hypothetical protein
MHSWGYFSICSAAPNVDSVDVRQSRLGSKNVHFIARTVSPTVSQWFLRFSPRDLTDSRAFRRRPSTNVRNARAETRKLNTCVAKKQSCCRHAIRWSGCTTYPHRELRTTGRKNAKIFAAGSVQQRFADVLAPGYHFRTKRDTAFKIS